MCVCVSEKDKFELSKMISFFLNISRNKCLLEFLIWMTHSFLLVAEKRMLLTYREFLVHISYFLSC